MRKVVLYIAMSLDGYIADERGGVGWLGGDGSDPGNPGSYSEFFKTVDTVIFGYRTYEQIVTELAPGRWDYAGKRSYVLTHRKRTNTEDVTFTDEAAADLVGRLKRQDGRDIWICGGAAVVEQLLSARAVDRLSISVMPTVLGGGIRLFPALSAPVSLRLVSARSYDGITDLVYDVKPRPDRQGVSAS